MRIDGCMQLVDCSMLNIHCCCFYCVFTMRHAVISERELYPLLNDIHYQHISTFFICYRLVLSFPIFVQFFWTTDQRSNYGGLFIGKLYQTGGICPLCCAVFSMK